MRAQPRPEQVSDRATAELVRLVGQTRRRLWIAAARALAARGESVVAWSLVNRLAELGPLTQRELADASAQHPAGVSRQLGELERKGLTSRGADPGDRRRRVVQLTSAGQRWVRQLRPVVDRATAPVLAVLRPSERRMLSGLLRRVAQQPESFSGPRRLAAEPGTRALRRRGRASASSG
ncbi:MAG TPA: MarR family transcriptional regulator [Myxococcaceae bacterium]|nr:MarR family transcriptional regulator [Myxococcaceae bacterium]